MVFQCYVVRVCQTCVGVVIVGVVFDRERKRASEKEGEKERERERGRGGCVCYQFQALQNDRKDAECTVANGMFSYENGMLKCLYEMVCFHTICTCDVCICLKMNRMISYENGMIKCLYEMVCFHTICTCDVYI